MLTDTESDEVAARIGQAQTQATAAGVPGTPTFYIQIGDEEPYAIETGLSAETIGQALDDALRG
jgi:predicted DsbA family dithiol-disulfide isomerase